MAQSSNYDKIKLNANRPQSYPSIKVQQDEPAPSSTYYEEDERPSHTLLDTPRLYTTVEHITVETDFSSTYSIDLDQTHICCQWIDEDPPDNSSYLSLAIFACCCCNSLLGFAVIIEAFTASKARDRGDVNAARRYNKMAYTLIRFSIGFGCICLIVSLYTALFHMI
ncbi:Hypothetical predicted protein [Mytilus galloprovincialis]|uniref:Uncharacterized protein n=1 Tax=Mytilus galloprovincialis TaxID=29158 RepID=A0A8B6GQ17_MYTGA|nr:Hypothetical predicted protein [Mytilus galloprovincialis]